MFWENFVSLCADRGMKPNPVAKELGISSGSVTSWKNGAIPHPTTLKKIADYFGVSVDYLLGKEKPATESDGQFEEVWKLFNQLNPAEQEQAVKYLEFLHATSSSKKS